MAEPKQTTLPDGDFLMLTDERDQPHLLSERRFEIPGTDSDFVLDQYDRDPERTWTIAMARLQRVRELNPGRAPPTVYRNFPTLWKDRRFRFDPDLVAETSYFYGMPPQSEIHYDKLIDFAREPYPDGNGKLYLPTDFYDVVSDTWKDAIEALEPGLHEFFPHTVEFANHTLCDHFIFRDAEEIDLIDYEHSEKPGAVEWHVHYGKGRYITKPNSKGLAAKRVRIAGRHWVRQIGVAWPIVSRELASALLPLLPDTIYIPNAIRFTPVIVV